MTDQTGERNYANHAGRAVNAVEYLDLAITLKTHIINYYHVINSITY